MPIVLFFFSSPSLADEVETTDPIFEAIVRLECKSGVPISYERGPTDHLLLEDVISVTGQPVMSRRTGEVLRTIPKYSFPIDTPDVQDKAAVLIALNSVLEARSTWNGWDGCTQYEAAETSHGINVSPTTVVRNGRCEPYVSHLHTRVGIGLSGWAIHGGNSMDHLLNPHRISFLGVLAGVHFPEDGSGMTVGEMLQSVQDQEPTISWEFFESNGSHTLRLRNVGQMADHLNPENYPFHASHAVERKRVELGMTAADLEAQKAERRREALEGHERAMQEQQQELKPPPQ